MFKTKTFYASLKGKRDENEDAHSIMNNKVNYFWGVYDGHGGKTVSHYLKEHLGKLLLSEKNKDGYKISYIKEKFNIIQKKLLDDSKKDKFDIHEVGSTCLVAMLTGNKLQVANLGDSRAVICQKDNLVKSLSLDDKPDWENEKKRIEKLGGKIEFDKDDDVYRIGDLSVSGAIGDLENKYVKHVPNVINYTVKSSDKFMILACDGLWDEACSQTAVNYVLNNKDKVPNIAHALAKWAINEKKSTDNVSIIVVFFEPLPQEVKMKKSVKKTQTIPPKSADTPKTSDIPQKKEVPNPKPIRKKSVKKTEVKDENKPKRKKSVKKL